MKFSAILLRALYILINKKMYLFTYLISHCCFQLSETDLLCLDECKNYIIEIFNQLQNAYLSIKTTMLNIYYLLKKIIITIITIAYYLKRFVDLVFMTIFKRTNLHLY